MLKTGSLMAAVILAANLVLGGPAEDYYTNARRRVGGVCAAGWESELKPNLPGSQGHSRAGLALGIVFRFSFTAQDAPIYRLKMKSQ
jgi:hypothetical protein